MVNLEVSRFFVTVDLGLWPWQLLSHFRQVFPKLLLRNWYHLLAIHVYVLWFSLKDVSSVVYLSSVMFVCPTQGVETFGNISLPFRTLAIFWPPCKILRRSCQGNPSVRGVKRKMGSKIERRHVRVSHLLVSFLALLCEVWPWPLILRIIFVLGVSVVAHGSVHVCVSKNTRFNW